MQKAFKGSVYSDAVLIFNMYCYVICEGFHKEDILEIDSMIFASRLYNSKVGIFLRKILKGFFDCLCQLFLGHSGFNKDEVR